MTEINSETVEKLTHSQEPIKSEKEIGQKSLLSKIIFLMNNNPNYKMLGALGMMLVNFSVCVTITNWLKHSSLISP